MRKIGDVPREDMLRAFNLGIGMVVIAAPKSLQFIEDQFTCARQEFYVIGEIVNGSGKVRFV
jgi:phosphoribosylaminoimidazole (AIR) synthetase